jgi:hypothetical protein
MNVMLKMSITANKNLQASNKSKDIMNVQSFEKT